MAYFGDIDYKASLEKKKLIFKSILSEIIESFFFLFGASYFVFINYSTYKTADLNNPNDSFIAYWALPIANVFLLFIIYRKKVEKKFLTIELNMDSTDARKKLVDLANSSEWEIIRNNKNYFQARTGFNLTWGKHITIIYAPDKLYLNVLRDNPIIRMPILFSHKSIKKQIEIALQLH